MTPAEKLIDSVCEPIEPPEDIKDGQPYATHSGILQVGEIELRVYILNTGQRIIDADDLKILFSAYNK